MPPAWTRRRRTPSALIEAHGTATPAGDAAELASLSRVFGATGPAIGLGSVKSMIGHAMPAAGIAGLIKAALAVHHGMLPPTLHCDDPHPALAGSRFAPVTEARPWDSPVRRAGGRQRVRVRRHQRARRPGGSRCHDSGVARRTPRGVASAYRRATPESPQPERVLLLAGETPADLAAQLAGPDLLTRDDSGARPDGGPCRLAIIGADARRLDLARRVVEQGKPWRGRNDLWFTPSPLLGAGGGEAGVRLPWAGADLRAARGRPRRGWPTRRGGLARRVRARRRHGRARARRGPARAPHRPGPRSPGTASASGAR